MGRERVAPLTEDRQLVFIFDPPEERSPEARDFGAYSTFGGVDVHHSPDPWAEQAAGHESDREGADNYRSVVIRLSERWRVVQCPVGIQWIIQTCRKAGRRGSEWKSKHHCATRDRLIGLCDACCGPLDPAATAVLLGLPEYCGGET